MKETMETYVLESPKTLHDNLKNRDSLVKEMASISSSLYRLFSIK